MSLIDKLNLWVWWLQFVNRGDQLVKHGNRGDYVDVNNILLFGGCVWYKLINKVVDTEIISIEVNYQNYSKSILSW